MDANLLRLWIFLFALSLMIAERLIAGIKRKKVYDRRETLANFGVLAGMLVSKSFFFSLQADVMVWVHSHAWFELRFSGVAFALCFLVVDFAYYWYHRWSHEVPFLWSFHMVHHSSTYMNMSASLRLNWFSPLVTVPYFAPLAMIFPPTWLAACLGLNLLYQLWLHTELIPKLGFLEGVMNTPSAHRVHHARNDPYIDRNHGGFFMVWDRLFHTYREEVEQPEYGVTTGFNSHNPAVLVCHGFVDWFRRVRSNGFRPLYLRKGD
ncbi:MAG: sterol desaturase family protein [Acidobacteria bacterium]|nr:sterol desaturase family protein [Acidobacteriota bacterium]